MTLVKNILTIDLEDWYSDLNLNYWHKFEDRIVQNTNDILKLLKEKKINATFFVLGFYAERYPELIEKIIENNHEIGSHGYGHFAITEQSHVEFEEDVSRSKKILERIVGERILGYRAPYFTITEETSWALKILKSLGFKYDSSIFPFKIYKYGVPDAPIFPYPISLKNIKKVNPYEEFLEFPPSVFQVPILKKNIPLGGGFYLRFFPYKFIYYNIKSINRKQKPAIMYTHPWEFDSNHPRVKSIVWYNYYNLKSTLKKFKRLINDFKFTSIRDWIIENI